MRRVGENIFRGNGRTMKTEEERGNTSSQIAEPGTGGVRRPLAREHRVPHERSAGQTSAAPEPQRRPNLNGAGTSAARIPGGHLPGWSA